jgi:hypothetical protein
MKRVFKTRYFAKQAAKSKLTDDMLCRAIEEMAAGLHDGDLGGHVKPTAGFSSTVSRKINAPISRWRNLKPCKIWRKFYWRRRLRNLNRP